MTGVDFGTDSVRSVVVNARSGEVVAQAVSVDVLIDARPCDHLAFAFGDRTEALALLLDIGHRIFDRRGREYSKPSQVQKPRPGSLRCLGEGLWI